MCGICGIILKNTSESHKLGLSCQLMAKQLTHRGPDSEGVWTNKDSTVAIGHRRLAIQDLDPHGKQPMTFEDCPYVIAFNGEIYNFRVLRDELHQQGYVFKTLTDTEVVLRAVQHWGLQAAVKKFVGMFAIAIFDKRTQKLFLLRDRAGEKPLYYGLLSEGFFFASELKAIRSHVSNIRISEDALGLFMSYSYVPTPYTIYQNIYKLAAGTILCVDTKDLTAKSALTHYWDINNIINEQTSQPRIDCPDKAQKELAGILNKTITQQLISDAPLGAFLSGGVDSSLICAIMQANSAKPIKTYTIGFTEKDFDESEQAEKTAQFLGTDHTTKIFSVNDMLNLVDKLPHLYDEPFADSSQLPTHLVSILASQHVTVALSGDGGDELFGGYNRYLAAENYWHQINNLPVVARKTISTLLRCIPPRTAQTLCRLAMRFNPSLPQLDADKVYKIADMMQASSPSALYNKLTCVASSHLLRGSLKTSSTDDIFCTPTMNNLSLPEKMMLADFLQYLPDDVLVKVDRAAMGVSLETRAPFLDHNVIEYAWSLSPELKLKNKTNKWLLRELLNQYLPDNLIQTRKVGFGVPICAWLRGELKEWAETLLSSHALESSGMLHSQNIRKIWKEHSDGLRNWQTLLWNVLMFQSWAFNQNSAMPSVND